MPPSLKRILLIQILVFSCALFGFGAMGWAQESGPSSTSTEIIGVDDAMRVLADGAWSEKKIAVAYLLAHGEPDILPQARRTPLQCEPTGSKDHETGHQPPS